jgi:hypothetical protein
LENRETKILPFKRHRWQILNGSGIKIIGTVLMVLDHLHQMFILRGAPDWLNWFGRPAAPLFIFLCAEGFYYTRDRKRYLLLLLIGSLFMSTMNRILTSVMFMEEVALINNIFGTLFLSTFYMGMIDLLRQGAGEKKPGRVLLALGGMLLPLLAGLGLLAALAAENRTALVILLFVPNPLSAEGGFAMIIMGILFYMLRKYRFAQVGVLIIISTLSWFTTMSPAGVPDAQWLMVLAIIPIILYNGSRGRQGKYFFYVFYPAHIYLFYTIAWLIR